MKKADTNKKEAATAPAAKGKPARLKIDWEAVELDYRAGVKTLRMMASEHGCAESAVRKKAKEQDWSRDLAAKVKQRTEENVRKEEVRKVVRTDDASERQQIEVLAEVQSNVILGHRKDIGKGRTLTMKLLQELEGQCDNPDLLEQLADLLLAPEDGESEAATRRKERMLEQFNRAVSLGGRVDTMKKLADSLKSLVELERKVYGINDEIKGSGTLEDFLDDL